MFRFIAPLAFALVSAFSFGTGSNALASEQNRLSFFVSTTDESTEMHDNVPFFLTVFTPWLVSVRHDRSAEQCAADVRSSGAAEVNTILDAIGVLIVTTPSSDKRALESLSCVLAVEADFLVSLAD
ncbi:MAG: hypothetical protein IOD12_02155 [Silvanigrellales bacterium]|jgi:hypothetical protein|nr:hypothetical protein [Silvanigrellales bacterium]